MPEMRRGYEEGRGGKMKCKWDEKKECRFERYLKREVEEGDCPFCMAVTFKGAAEELMDILLEVGAGRRAGEFGECFRDILRLGEELRAMTERLYPEIAELARQREEAAYGVPKEVEEALRRFLKRDDGGVV